MMKVVLGAFCLIGCCASAAAEERWSGAHVGLVVAHADGAMTSATGFSADSPGKSVGVAAGYNWSWDGVLVGLEGDVNFSNIGYSDPTAAATITSMSTARVRVGLPIERGLPYVTAGLALATGKLEVDVPTAEDQQGHLGVTAGAGVEFALTEAASAKVEYLYVRLPPEAYW